MKKIIILFITLLFCTVSFAQKGLEWMTDSDRSMLDSVMNINYTPQKGYQAKYIDVSFADFNIKTRFFDIHNKLHILSEDKHFAVSMFKKQPFLQEDSIFFAQYIPDHPEYPIQDPDRVDKEHLFFIQELVRQYYNKEESANWQNFANYLPGIEAKNKFNADTALYVTLPLLNDFYVKGYPYCTALIIQKKGRGFFTLFLLYNNESKNNLAEYITGIERSFRYGDEPPAKEKLDAYTTIRPPRQKKQNPIR